MSLLRDAATFAFFRRGVSSADSCFEDVKSQFKKAARASPVKNDPVADNKRVTSKASQAVDACCEAIKSATSSLPRDRVPVADAVAQLCFGGAGEDELITMFSLAYTEAMRLVISADDPEDAKETNSTYIPPVWTTDAPWQTEGQVMAEEEVSCVSHCLSTVFQPLGAGRRQG